MQKRTQYLIAVGAATTSLGLIKLLGWGIDAGVDAFLSLLSKIVV